MPKSKSKAKAKRKHQAPPGSDKGRREPKSGGTTQPDTVTSQEVLKGQNLAAAPATAAVSPEKTVVGGGTSLADETPSQKSPTETSVVKTDILGSSPPPPDTQSTAQETAQPGKANLKPKNRRSGAKKQTPDTGKISPDLESSEFQVRTPRASVPAPVNPSLLAEPEFVLGPVQKRRNTKAQKTAPAPSPVATVSPTKQTELALHLTDPLAPDREDPLPSLPPENGVQEKLPSGKLEGLLAGEPVLTEPALLQGRLFEAPPVPTTRSRTIPEEPADFAAPARSGLPVRVLVILLGTAAFIVVVFMAGVEIQRLLDTSAQHQRDLIFRDRRHLDRVAAP